MVYCCDDGCEVGETREHWVWNREEERKMGSESA